MNPLRAGLAAAAVAALAACESSEPPPISFPDIRFDAASPIRLDVARVDIVSAFEPSFQPPEVEHRFPVPPQRAIENWVHDRLQAVNLTSPYTLKVTILDASAREVPSPPIEHQDETYNAAEDVKIEVLDARGFTVRSASAQAVRTRTVQRDSFQNTIDAAWYQMTKDLTTDLSQKLEQSIQSSFYPYVVM